MIKDFLLSKYGEYLTDLDIHENRTSIILSKIIVKDIARGDGIGTKVMNDLINYADNNKQIIVLTPSSDYGGDKNRLIQFYKKFGFKYNQSIYKHTNFDYEMIRYPKLNEMSKILIKKLLNEHLFDKNSESHVDALNKFISFSSEFLKVKKPKVVLQFNHDGLVTTASYGDDKVHVYSKDRALIDIMRSIAHEMTHMKQDAENRLDQSKHDVNNKAGSPIENEANAKAGEIIRKFGELHPKIYV
jgi:predicted GNAT family acetyltransferase